MFPKTLSVVSFFGALAIGVAAAYLTGSSFHSGFPLAAEFTTPDRVIYSSTTENPAVQLEAKDLVGRWRGSWGYGDKEAMIYIDRVEGNRFYGNLTVHGALIAVEGSVDSEGIYFRETEVLSIDKSLGEWSLGKDVGTFSSNGKTMLGEGQDDYGFYHWSMTKQARNER